MKKIFIVFLAVTLSACSSNDAQIAAHSELGKAKDDKAGDVLWKFNSKKPDMPASVPPK